MRCLVITGALQGRVRGRAHAEQALDLARRLGDREWEGRCLNLLGIGSRDHGLRRAYYERAMATALTIDHLPYQAMLHNNLAPQIGAWGCMPARATTPSRRCN